MEKSLILLEMKSLDLYFSKKKKIFRFITKIKKEKGKRNEFGLYVDVMGLQDWPIVCCMSQ